MAEKNAELAVTKENQINGPISKKYEDFQLVQSTFSDNRDHRDHAQSVIGKINHVAKGNLLQKETSVIATVDEYEQKNKEIETKMQASDVKFLGKAQFAHIRFSCPESAQKSLNLNGCVIGNI